MNFVRRHLWLILALAIAIFAGRMLLTSHHFYTHDDIQVIRVSEFVGCLKSLQLPCRWAPNLGKGYGYPWFNYYPPMIYVIPSLLNITGVSIITSLNLFNFATFLLAAWSMFALVNTIFKRPEIAFLSSTLYTLYPFHASNVFVRGVMAENLAWSFAPLLLLMIYRQQRYNRFVHALPFGFAFIFLTHIISSFVLLGIAVSWALLLAFEQKSLRRSLSRLFCQIIIGLGIAAFFFVPAIVEKDLVQSDSLTKGYYAYTNHYVSFYQLFIEHKWNYEASYWDQVDFEMPFMVGHIHTTLLIILLTFIGFLRPKHSARTLILAGSLLLGSFGLLFLSHFKSDFLWSLIPPMAYIQFPWRFIVWAGLPLALASTFLLSLIPPRLGHAIVILTSTFLIIYSYPFFFPRGYDSYVDADFLPGGGQYPEQQVKSFFDYLPKTVHTPPSVYAAESSFSLPVFYFPGWVANVPIQPDPISGMIVPTDPHSSPVIIKWRETPFRLSMDILSILSLVGYIFYLRRAHVQ